jgi:hypothetical protein
MSQHPSHHPNYDDAASALIELAGHLNGYSGGVNQNGAIFVPVENNNQEKFEGTVSQTAASVKPSPAAVAAANRFPGKVCYVC